MHQHGYEIYMGSQGIGVRAATGTVAVCDRNGRYAMAIDRDKLKQVETEKSFFKSRSLM